MMKAMMMMMAMMMMVMMIIHKISRYIGFTMYSTCIVWLAFIPIFFGTNHDYQVKHYRIGISISINYDHPVNVNV